MVLALISSMRSAKESLLRHAIISYLSIRVIFPGRKDTVFFLYRKGSKENTYKRGYISFAFGQSLFRARANESIAISLYTLLR